MHKVNAALLACCVMLAGCATGPGADLNQTASLADLEARIKLLEEKLNLAMKSAAAAKVDAAAALRLATEGK